MNGKISQNRSLMLIKPVSSASEICWKLELLNLAITAFLLYLAGHNKGSDGAIMSVL